ncbi:MAG: O-antigen ligase family protein [Chloroflexia bacterium]
MRSIRNTQYAIRQLPSWWPTALRLLLTAVVAYAVAYAINRLPPLYTAAAVAGSGAAFLLLRKPVLGAYALVLSVPVQKAVSYDAGPIEITVTQVLFVGVLAIWWAWLSVREDRRLVLTPIAISLLLFFVATLPSLLVTTSMPQSLAELSRWLVTILAYVIVTNSVCSRHEMNILIGCMLAAGMSEALLGLVQSYTGAGPASFNVGGLLTRAYGTIGAPNSFAGYLNMSLPLAIALAVYHWGSWFSARNALPILDRPSYLTFRNLRWPLLLTFVALTLFWAVITSLSRGAWIGLTFGVLAMVLALGRRAAAALALLAAGALLLVILGLAGALPAPITDRVGLLLSQIVIFDPRGVVPNPDNYALVERMVHWQVAGNMFLYSPLVGIGIGNYNVLFSKFGVQGWPTSAGHAHNYYLHSLAETGLVGTTFYLVMLITAVTAGIVALRRAREARDAYGEAVVIGAIGVLVTFMAHNFFEDLHVLNMGIQWGAALALFSVVSGHELSLRSRVSDRASRQTLDTGH